MKPRRSSWTGLAARGFSVRHTSDQAVKRAVEALARGVFGVRARFDEAP